MNVLSLIVFLPLVAAAALAFVPARLGDRVFTWSWGAAAAADLVLVVAMWIGFDADGGISYEQRLRWMPSVGIDYHVGIDGLALPLVAVTAVLFLACAIYSQRRLRSAKPFVLLFLCLQTVSLGLFTALDLILFFVYFDLSIVGMYFVIAAWGHGNARKSALKFFLYTFVGSLVLLLGFIGLYLAAEPHTFDIVELARANPLAGRETYGAVVLLAIGLGFAIKTPTVPFHTWLPPAHTDAPATGSVILAGVLLKMGTYGFVRIAMPLLPQSWREYAWIVVIVGVVSVLYGALVALAQEDFKRMIAYTSVNHMGYVVLAVGAAGLIAEGDEQARSLAVTGAVTQMVSHGLLTGALFLIAGVLFDRRASYDMGSYSGLAGRAPVLAGATALAAFGSLGLPGLSGFVAEFQIFTGSLASASVPTALALLGILITAGLLLRAFHRMFLGAERLPDTPGSTRRFEDLRSRELFSVLPLLVLAVVIGLLPRFLLDVVEPSVTSVIGVIGR
ncbi:NADH dehydrogenase subunit M [Actinopolyspora alba]|uniref:NADH dehydrogenase subunit M n=1 Tax=Actinopolyspora alba TaxID=673379 RepID=A0A1I2AFL2_9ACTN|nr:NADH dehydrogenase subunit M [Actinopolyspora alba]